MRKAVLCIVLYSLCPLNTLAAEDVILGAFSGKDYGSWKAEGEAFGKGPINGSAFSRNGGDKATGALTSPAFVINRRFLNFRIGGGMQPGKLHMDLLIDCKVVRTATGKYNDWNAEPDGWDVSDLANKTASLRIVDEATRGMGFIVVSQIVLSDRRPLAMVTDAQREIVLDKPLLMLPVMPGPERWITLLVEGEQVRKFNALLPEQGPPQHWFPIDVSPWKGKKMKIVADRLVEGARSLDLFSTADAAPDEATIYHEASRPQFHFTPRRGFIGDPNGLVYSQGQWHLFFQYNPFGPPHANMCWGHAVSDDLVHWKELPVALYNDIRQGGLGSIYSGSGLVDKENTAGFKSGSEDPIVLAFLATAMGPSLAYSNDRGRTFRLYDQNPVIRNGGWDPKVIWHTPTKRWIMGTSLGKDGKPGITLYSSTDLKHWNYESCIAGFNECPELFQLPVDGNPSNLRWVLYGNGGPYVVGQFDGHKFTIEHGPYPKSSGGNFGAPQTFTDAPDGRRIEIGNGGGGRLPDLAVSQLLTFPVELTLHTTDDGIRLFKVPVKDVETLRAKKHVWQSETIMGTKDLLSGLKDDLLDIVAEFEVTGETARQGVQFGLAYRNVPLMTYDAGEQQFHGFGAAPLKPERRTIRVRILVDRLFADVFANDGRVYMPGNFRPRDADRTLRVLAKGGSVKMTSLEVYELKSAWEQ